MPVIEIVGHPIANDPVADADAVVNGIVVAVVTVLNNLPDHALDLLLRHGTFGTTTGVSKEAARPFAN